MRRSIPSSSGAAVSADVVCPTVVRRSWGWWAHLFLAVVRRNDAGVSAYDDGLAAFCLERLRPTAGASLADVGCGAGDVAVRLAAAGHRVLGLDVSTELVAHCRSLAPADGAARFVVHDMRRPLPEAEFAGVVCLGVTFGYFSDAENALALHNMARALAPGGLLLIESDNPLDMPSGRVEQTHDVPGHGRLVMRRRFDAEAGAYEGWFHLEGEHGRTVLDRPENQPWDERIRIYRTDELEAMAQAAGLTAVTFHGDSLLPVRPYGPTSRRLVMEARRR